MPNTLHLCAYTPQWPTLFQEETERIKNDLGHNCMDIFYRKQSSSRAFCKAYYRYAAHCAKHLRGEP